MYEFEEVVHWIDYNIELKKFTLKFHNNIRWFNCAWTNLIGTILLFYINIETKQIENDNNKNIRYFNIYGDGTKYRRDVRGILTIPSATTDKIRTLSTFIF